VQAIDKHMRGGVVGVVEFGELRELCLAVKEGKRIGIERIGSSTRGGVVIGHADFSSID
jgi:hypothetical protein